jgi:hypothetical protein
MGPGNDRRDDTHHHFSDALDEVYEAAIAAELETGGREETEAEARRGVVLRMVRTVAGFIIIGIGMAGLALPGPGWLVIILGLSLLPFSWAERTIRTIRRRVPGIPEDGRIPLTTWIVMGGMVVVASVASVLWGATVAQFVRELWGDPTKFFF